MEEHKEDSKKPHRDRHSGRVIITVHNPKILAICVYLVHISVLTIFYSFYARPFYNRLNYCMKTNILGLFPTYCLQVTFT